MSATTRAAEQPKNLWFVLDKNAYQGPRIHEAGNRRYSLTNDPDKPTPMPREHALLFLKDPAFVVTDENGVTQAPIPTAEAARKRKVGAEEMEPGQCVAFYEELTSPALLARAAQRPGGNLIDPLSKRADIIAFLVKGNPGSNAGQRAGVIQATVDAEASLLEEDEEEGEGATDPDGAAPIGEAAAMARLLAGA